MSEFDKRNLPDEANSIIKNHMIWSMGAGLIPVPFADILAVSAIQLDMIRQIAKVYGVDYKQTEGKAIIATLASGSLSRLSARAVKFIPGVGSLIGGVTMAVLSGGSTYAIGEVFKKHFETGGTFLDFDTERLKKYYNEKFEKGKEIAEELRKKQGSQQNDMPIIPVEDDVITKLKELANLKEKGLIDDEEFEILKRQLIAK